MATAATTRSAAAFKSAYDHDARAAESARVRQRYPDRIPCIVERGGDRNVPEIDRAKFLVPTDLTMGQLAWVVRKRIQLPAERALFLMVGTCLMPSSALVLNVYEERKDADGFLYVTYAGENTFGGATGCSASRIRC